MLINFLSEWYSFTIKIEFLRSFKLDGRNIISVSFLIFCLVFILQQFFHSFFLIKSEMNNETFYLVKVRNIEFQIRLLSVTLECLKVSEVKEAVWEMSRVAGPVSDITLSKCLLCGLSSHPYLGHVTAQVPAHQLCIKFAKGIKNKKFVIGKTRLEVIRYH